MKVFKRVYSNFDQNHRAPYSLKHLDSMLDLVCIWDREKDTCQEEIVMIMTLSPNKMNIVLKK